MKRVYKAVLVFGFALGPLRASGQVPSERISSLEEGAPSRGGAAPEKRNAPVFHDRDARYKVQWQDILSISFTLSPEFDQKAVAVGRDGYIALLGTNSLEVQGLTLPEIAHAVKKSYAGILHDPIVEVDVLDFQRPTFTVLGQVGRPGKYDLRQKTSLPEAIAMAGGFVSTAKTQVFVIRRVSGGTAKVTSYQLSDFLEGKPKAIEPLDLKPGDIVFVPEKFIAKFKKYVTYGSVGGLSATSLY